MTQVDVSRQERAPNDGEPRSESRLTWGPAVHGPHLAAAWWPRTRNAVAELPDLVAAAGQRMGGQVTRVSLSIDGWDSPQPRRMSVGDQVVRLGWYHHIDPHMVTVGRGTFDRISIAVLPSDMDAAAAGRILRGLESAPQWPDTPEELLAAEGTQRPADEG